MATTLGMAVDGVRAVISTSSRRGAEPQMRRGRLLPALRLRTRRLRTDSALVNPALSPKRGEGMLAWPGSNSRRMTSITPPRLCMTSLFPKRIRR
jgi:hypothetical protein